MAIIIPSGLQIARPEEHNKIIKGEDFWAYRLASDIVHEAFLRQQRIVHASELAYVAEQNRGYKDGIEKAQADSAERMMDIINSTVFYLSKTEQQFAALVLDAVKQVISDYDEKEKTLAVVKAGMAAMRGQKHIILTVSPEHRDLVEAELKTLHQAFPLVSHVEVVAQSDVPEDACIVSTEIGSAQASISAQLNALRASLVRIFGSTGTTVQKENEQIENKKTDNEAIDMPEDWLGADNQSGFHAEL